MDHEEERLLGWPSEWFFSLREHVITVIVGLIIVIGLGFWQVFVIVADHQRGQPGDGRGHDGLCRASTPDAAGCRLPPREAD
jgi:hypothetical protein